MKRSLFVIVGSLVLAAAFSVTPSSVAVGAGPTPPNVVIFVSDDQAKGTMDAMPAVRALIAREGVTLTNGIIPTSICCPSRAALLSGRYARSTGVYKNVGTNGGWPTFNSSGAEDRTIAVALQDAGYRTGLFGKYLNGYGGLAPSGYVPPGWDQFRAIYNPDGKPALSANAYHDYNLHGTGDDVSYGSEASDYSTDVITSESVQFINSAPADQPLFLYYATTGPHAPFTPAPRHIGTWPNETLNPAAYTLTLNRPKWRPDTTLSQRKWITKQASAHEALMSVDEGVEAVVNALGDRVDNTLFVYLSDNGLQFGEHGLSKKNEPYSGSTEVPMYLRWNGAIPAGTKSTSPVTNADLTATIADAAGVSLFRPDGVSFFSATRPRGVVLEAVSSASHPAYCGYRTRRFMYVEYDMRKGREFFDYRDDPDELVNKVKWNRYTNRVAVLRDEAMSGCSPTPEGFDW